MTSAAAQRLPVSRALLSVADKAGLERFAARLVNAGVTLIASEGTALALERAGIPVRRVADVTGAPEILSGRVKTMHPKVMGAVLGDPTDPRHRADFEQFGIAPIDLVVVVPYRVPADPGVGWDDVVESVDIGGPALLRAAAKNHGRVAVVADPDQYDEVAEAVGTGGTDLAMRRRLARRALFEAASLDAALLTHLAGGDPLPGHLLVPYRRSLPLRYGENPDQQAAAYAGGNDVWWADALISGGADLSATNLADADAALRLALDLHPPAAVVIKHTNPCGAAEADTPAAAFAAAWAGDERAAYGGVVGFNATLDAPAAEAIASHFVEVVAASQITPEARAILERRSRLRVLEAPRPPAAERALAVGGGLVLQTAPAPADPAAWRVVAGPPPDAATLEDLRVAWTVASHAASNAVVVVSGRSAVGVGAGDQARVGAAERAVARAGDRAAGAVAASDGFLPFRDGLDVLADAGVAAVVEPGGSRRDPEVAAAARERGVTLVFTGTRRFRH